MKKIVNPCVCSTYYGNAQAYAKIKYEDRRLSIFGVVGPKKNGDCKGSAGQCVDEIRAGKPGAGWNEEMLQKFCDIWDRWHLNDMRPYCQHQKELGWDKLAGKKVTLYNYRITNEASRKKRNAEMEAIKALKDGRTFTPTAEQTKFASLPYGIKTHQEISGETALLYKPEKALYPGGEGPTEEKTLGCLYEKDHPDGILGKACPVCGYKYGTSWIKEDVPQEVIDWLFALPDTTVKPAWV